VASGATVSARICSQSIAMGEDLAVSACPRKIIRGELIRAVFVPVDAKIDARASGSSRARVEEPAVSITVC